MQRLHVTEIDLVAKQVNVQELCDVLFAIVAVDLLVSLECVSNVRQLFRHPLLLLLLGLR
jgi:hypothetical protein